MTDLSAQRRLAADVMDVGTNKVWLDPERQGDIADAITRADVRDLVQEGAIRAEEPQGNSRGRARERRGDAPPERRRTIDQAVVVVFRRTGVLLDL